MSQEETNQIHSKSIEKDNEETNQIRKKSSQFSQVRVDELCCFNLSSIEPQDEEEEMKLENQNKSETSNPNENEISSISPMSNKTRETIQLQKSSIDHFDNSTIKKRSTKSISSLEMSSTSVYIQSRPTEVLIDPAMKKVFHDDENELKRKRKHIQEHNSCIELQQDDDEEEDEDKRKRKRMLEIEELKLFAAKRKKENDKNKK